MITQATHSNSLFFTLKYFHHVYEMIYAENSALYALWFKYNKYLINVFSMWQFFFLKNLLWEQCC